MTPTDLMRKYWDNVAARDGPLWPIWAVVTTTQHPQQPPGYCMFWSVNKRNAESWYDKRGDSAALVLVRVEPPTRYTARDKLREIGSNQGWRAQ